MSISSKNIKPNGDRLAAAKARGVYQGKKPGSLHGRKQGGPDKVKKVAELRKKAVRINDIAASIGLSRSTVKRYIAIARDEGLIES